MKNNWTNVLLAVLLAFELATGLFGLVSGGADRGFVLVLHNIGAFAIVAIAGWKVAIVAGSLRRRSGGAARLASITLSFLVLAAFGLGLAWSLNGFFRLAGITGLTWHMFRRRRRPADRRVARVEIHEEVASRGQRRPAGCHKARWGGRCRRRNLAGL